MNEPKITFDECTDTLTVVFRHDEAASVIQLNEYITIHVDIERQRTCGLTLADYSLLVSETKRGSRCFPLVRLNMQPAPLRNLVLDLLGQEPASQFVALGLYTPSLVDTMPVLSVKALFAVESPLEYDQVATA